MKLLHMADLHIGRQLAHYSLREEQQDMLRRITELAVREQVDGVLIAGDVYDKPVPSAEAVALLDEFLSGLDERNIAVFMIAGNHDSGERIDFASSILARHQVHIAGLPPRRPEEYLRHVELKDDYGGVRIYLLPFVKPSYVRQAMPEQEIDSYETAVRLLLEREQVDAGIRNVLVAHQFVTAGGAEPEKGDSELLYVGGVDHVDVSVFEPFDYVALGHIHRAQRIGRESCRYAGAPLAYSVKEAEHEKSVTLVELREKGVPPVIRQIPLQPLRRVRVIRGELEEILAAACRNDTEASGGATPSGKESCRNDDYVSIILEDETEPYKPRERLEGVFSRILSIQLDNSRTRMLWSGEEEQSEEMPPREVFARFFREVRGREMNEGERQMFEKAWNKVVKTEEGV